jgi:DUF971 family protein
MDQDQYIPISIKANRQRNELSIDWSDGHQSIYPFWLLRAGCPCVTCRGGHANMTSEPPTEVFTANLPDSPAIHMVKIEAVGSYAITIEWEDGHRTGIYNWHYLRKLCPCCVCRSL